MKSDVSMTNILPEECISYILSFTSPTDVCRSKLVSPVFRSAADSDTIWGKFLPPDCYDIVSKSSSSSSANQSIASMSKTQLYFHLCRNPVIIDNGTMVNISVFFTVIFSLIFVIFVIKWVSQDLGIFI